MLLSRSPLTPRSPNRRRSLRRSSGHKQSHKRSPATRGGCSPLVRGGTAAVTAAATVGSGGVKRPRQTPSTQPTPTAAHAAGDEFSPSFSFHCLSSSSYSAFKKRQKLTADREVSDAVAAARAKVLRKLTSGKHMTPAQKRSIAAKSALRASIAKQMGKRLPMTHEAGDNEIPQGQHSRCSPFNPKTDAAAEVAALLKQTSCSSKLSTASTRHRDEEAEEEEEEEAKGEAKSDVPRTTSTRHAPRLSDEELQFPPELLLPKKECRSTACQTDSIQSTPLHTCHASTCLSHNVEHVRIVSIERVGNHAEYRIALRCRRGTSFVSMATRRFREFDELNMLLQTELSAHDRAGLPSLPAKTVFRSLERKFLQQRRVELEGYLAALCRHPTASTTQAWRHFIAGTGSVRRAGCPAESSTVGCWQKIGQMESMYV